MNTAIHAGMVCQPDRMATTQERPQDIRVSDVEHPQTDTILRGWAFALRDLCDQGARSVLVSLADDVTLAYSPEQGARLITKGQVVLIPDAELDDVGYLPADVALSSIQSPQEEA